jgi:hypothetical protein
MTVSKERSKFKSKKQSNEDKNDAEFNAIYKASIDCRKEEIDCRKEELAMKKQATTIQSMAVLNQEKQRGQGVVRKYEVELLEAVIEADGLQNLTPKTQRKRAKTSMKKRIKRHGQWKAQYGGVDSKDEDVPSQDTCESKINRFEEDQQSVTATQNALAVVGVAICSSGWSLSSIASKNLLMHVVVEVRDMPNISATADVGSPLRCLMPAPITTSLAMGGLPLVERTDCNSSTVISPRISTSFSNVW